MAHMGLALATSIAAGLNMLILLICLQKRIKLKDIRNINLVTWLKYSSYPRVLLASGIMGIICWYINISIDGYLYRTGCGIIAGGLVFFITCLILKVKETSVLLNYIMRYFQGTR
jgi:putative peptidoglycan lipid II flippase